MTIGKALRYMPVREILGLVPDVEHLVHNSWIEEQYLSMGPVCVTDAAYPGGHFGTYFGALPLRQGVYKNPVIQLLYYLHELRHVQTIRYGNHRTWLEWAREIIASELVSSLTSECYVHLRVPGLRKVSFQHEIWVDRYLPLMRFLPVSVVEWYIRRERLRALHDPKFNDFIERQIMNYGQQNFKWCRIWAEPVGYGVFAERPAYRVVEEHMSSPDARDPALHSEWLAAVTRAEDGVPFGHQADAFQAVYHESNQNYGNQMLLT